MRHVAQVEYCILEIHFILTDIAKFDSSICVPLYIFVEVAGTALEYSESCFTLEWASNPMRQTLDYSASVLVISAKNSQSFYCNLSMY